MIDHKNWVAGEMTIRSKMFTGVAAFAAFALMGDSADVATNIGGFHVVVCPGGSDTIVSAPFYRPASFSGAVSESPSINGDTATILILGNISLQANAFSGTPHYLRFVGDSVLSGMSFPVTGNGSASVTIDLSGGELGDVAVYDRFEVIPHWTLDSLFGPGNELAVHQSGSVLRADRRSEVLFFDETSTGIDLSPDRIFFRTAQGWVEAGGDYPPAGGVIIPPGKPIVIRHRTGEPATRFTTFQWVNTGRTISQLKTRVSGGQDIAIGLDRPVRVKLSDLGLEENGAFVESVGTDPADRKDELHLFDNSVAAINKAPSAVYFRVAGHWHRDVTGFPLADDDEVESGSGLMIRKAATAAGSTAVWLNTPRY